MHPRVEHLIPRVEFTCIVLNVTVRNVINLLLPRQNYRSYSKAVTEMQKWYGVRTSSNTMKSMLGRGLLCRSMYFCVSRSLNGEVVIVVSLWSPQFFFKLSWFLATFVVCCRPSVCRLSACRPKARASYSASWNFRQCFYAIWYLGQPLTSTKNFTKIVPGEPLCRGVKRKRGSQIQRFLTCRRLYLRNGAR